jgi:hypothetical protein
VPRAVGPSFNDEYGDVYSVIYMLTADGLSLAELKIGGSAQSWTDMQKAYDQWRA